jgi:hypothetical protein
VSNRIFAVIALVFLIGFPSIIPGQNRPTMIKPLPLASSAQEGYSTNKTTEDYMETVLSRDTKPLGLKENVAVRNLLSQSAVKWAIRCRLRHALD